MSVCKAPVVKGVGPSLPLAKMLGSQVMRKKVDGPWFQEPESYPGDPILKNQFLYSFQHINGFNFSFSLSACNLFDGAPIWKLRASSGMHELQSPFVTVLGGPAFHRKCSLFPKHNNSRLQGTNVVCTAWATSAVRPAGLSRFPYGPAFSKLKEESQMD